jgi:hypothetical protein
MEMPVEIRFIAIIAFALLTSVRCALAEPKSQEQLEAAAEAGLKIDAAYEMKAMPAYFGDGAFMAKCAPPGSPVSDPFTIYISVSSVGRIEDQVAYPASAVARCMINASSGRSLPAPKAALVVKLEMRFTE